MRILRALAIAATIATAAVLFQALAPAQGAPAEATTAKGWAAEWMVGRDGEYTRAEAVEIAKSYNVIAAQPFTFRGHADAMRAANPDIVLLAYVNGPFAASWLDDYPEHWYAHNAAGERIRSVRFGNFLMNVNKTVWRNEVVRLCERAVRLSEFDGCFLDTMGNGIIESKYLDSKPVDPRTGEEWDSIQWIKDTGAIADHVRKTMNVPVGTNGLGSGPRYFEFGAHHLAAGSDLSMAESFLRHPGHAVDHFPKVSQWLENVEMIRDAETRGTRVLTVTKLWTETTAAERDQWFDFTLASLLLATDGSSEMFFLADGCPKPCEYEPSVIDEHPSPNVAIGTPTGDYQANGAGYTRTYTDGLVAVNPTDAATTVTFSGTYRDDDGNVYAGEMVLPAHTGWVLEAEGATPPPTTTPPTVPDDPSTDAPSDDEPVDEEPAEDPADQAPATATCNGLKATIVGTNGDDVITGTSGHDIIAGLGGDDRIDGLSGNDIICGHHGNDTLIGLGGEDLILGGDGDDKIWGGGADDVLIGGNGHDILRGEKGHDELDGRAGNDQLLGNEGDDTLNGGNGNDYCNGGYHWVADAARNCEDAEWVEA